MLNSLHATLQQLFFRKTAQRLRVCVFMLFLNVFEKDMALKLKLHLTLFRTQEKQPTKQNLMLRYHL